MEDQSKEQSENTHNEMMKALAEEEKDPKKWKENRARNYPDYQTQLEKIADDGIDTWKSEMLDPIKTKFPKP